MVQLKYWPPPTALQKCLAWPIFPRGYHWKLLQEPLKGWEIILVQFGCFMGGFVVSAQFLGDIVGIILGFFLFIFFVHGFIVTSLEHGPGIFCFVITMIMSTFLLASVWIYVLWFGIWANDTNVEWWKFIEAVYLILTPFCAVHTLILALLGIDIIRGTSFSLPFRKWILPQRRRRAPPRRHFTRLEEPVGDDGAEYDDTPMPPAYSGDALPVDDVLSPPPPPPASAVAAEVDGYEAPRPLVMNMSEGHIE